VHIAFRDSTFDSQRLAFWYLHPFFLKIETETGELVDLYGGATFRGPSIEILSRELANAEHLLAGKPNTWAFRETFGPGGNCRADMATKAHVAAIIRRLRLVVQEASESGAVIEFVGD
jgi:hypothetical protein